MLYKFKLITLSALLYIISAVYSHSAYATQEITIECNSCSTQTDFENTAISYMSTAPEGHWNTIVINTSINTKIWYIELDVVQDANNFGAGTAYLISSVRETAVMESNVSELIQSLKKPISVHIPENHVLLEECGSATYGLCGILSTFLRGTPEGQAFFATNTTSILFYKIFGITKTIRFLVHFPDGTSILYESLLEGAFTPPKSFTPVPDSIVGADGAISNNSVYASAPTGGSYYATSSTVSGGTSCEMWMWVTRVNGEISSITFSYI
ncbi:hypothetical protein [Paraglaciecola sp. MB-3u-78]|uniref:hypothetical protein n=1 Tax=Paraglaciecola sp. MB-3u-78 TaxID=2058332 RepID=UPI000C33A097|nr:hypothetical protein [Paraglaciecola sp. MB-3u-78]PKG96805.1 hypothetical protein CXF95_23675 [Paraglaciecola sp. MB-3u-78]